MTKPEMPETVSLMPLVEELVRLRAENEALKARFAEQAVQFDQLLQQGPPSFERSLVAVDVEVSSRMIAATDSARSTRESVIREFSQKIVDRRLFQQLLPPVSLTSDYRVRAYFVGFK